MLQYVIIDDERLQAPLPEMLRRLPTWRRDRAMQFKHEQGRRECALSYQLLADMLGYEPEFSIGEHGKPYIEQSDVRFNLSHCKAAVGCVIGSGEVGIDVECLGRYNDRLARYCMSSDELDQIAAAPDPDAQFTMLWTQKEALLKLTGEGITDDMRSCLTSDRMRGVKITSGVNKEKGYAWSVAAEE